MSGFLILVPPLTSQITQTIWMCLLYILAMNVSWLVMDNLFPFLTKVPHLILFLTAPLFCLMFLLFLPLQKILFLLVNLQNNLIVVLYLILLVLIYRIKLPEWYWGSVDVKMVYMFLISTIVLLLQLSLPISHKPQFVYGMHD